MPPIRFTGHVDVPQACRAAVAAALPEHIRLNRAEPGCRSFDVTPDPDGTGRWQVAESFDDRAGFAAHRARTGARARGRIAAGLARHDRLAEIAA